MPAETVKARLRSHLMAQMMMLETIEDSGKSDIRRCYFSRSSRQI